jgi:hypothetical protein
MMMAASEDITSMRWPQGFEESDRGSLDPADGHWPLDLNGTRQLGAGSWGWGLLRNGSGCGSLAFFRWN